MHKIKTHQSHLLNSMVLWQFISKCLIIFIVQLNKELIKKSRLSWKRSAWSVLPDVDARIRQCRLTYGPLECRRIMGWNTAVGVRGTLKRYPLPSPLRQNLMPLVRETAVVLPKSFYTELFSNWDPWLQLSQQAQECSVKSIFKIDTLRVLKVYNIVWTTEQEHSENIF